MYLCTAWQQAWTRFSLSVQCGRQWTPWPVQCKLSKSWLFSTFRASLAWEERLWNFSALPVQQQVLFAGSLPCQLWFKALCLPQPPDSEPSCLKGAALLWDKDPAWNTTSHFDELCKNVNYSVSKKPGPGIPPFCCHPKLDVLRFKHLFKSGTTFSAGQAFRLKRAASKLIMHYVGRDAHISECYKHVPKSILTLKR